MGPADFQEFVVTYDRRLTDIIHDANGLVWCHSHGSINKVLEGFAEAGVDCLQPLEPPPMATCSSPTPNAGWAGGCAWKATSSAMSSTISPRNKCGKECAKP